VRARGLRFAAGLGLVPGTPIDQTLDRLVGHFRAFVEADEIPSATGDLYLDLARGGVGVCRHRAYAFVVTALALSLPARYVQNEAHAWVEVELRDGWLRIDLGGSASGVNAHGLQDRPKHEVSAPDPFPQPEIYVRDYLERGVAPLDLPTPGEAAQNGSSESPASTSTTNGARTSENDAVQSSGMGQATAPESGANQPTMEGTSSADATESAADSQTNDRRIGSAVSLDEPEHRVYRGQMLDLAGTILDEHGQPIGGGRIEVRVEGGRLLGVALSGPDGRFGLSLGIPPDLGVGRHSMQVTFVGSRLHRPASAP